MDYLREEMGDYERILNNDLSPWSWYMMTHLLTHLADQLEEYGPMREYWMFRLESFFGVQTQLIKTRSNPEANLMQTRSTIKAIELARGLVAQVVRMNANQGEVIKP
jgi:hypothetical protein